MAEYHLAQLNIAKMKFPIDAPEMVEFVDRLGQLRRVGPGPRAFTRKQRCAPA